MLQSTAEIERASNISHVSCLSRVSINIVHSHMIDGEIQSLEFFCELSLTGPGELTLTVKFGVITGGGT